MFRHILLTLAPEGIATITLNRPEVYNAINTGMLQELRTAYAMVEGDHTIKVTIITGSGKGFCAGQDLSMLLDSPDLVPSAMVREYYNPLILAMRQSSKPIICKLNGVAAGAGFSLALSCDMIIASEQATISEAFVNIGLVPDSGSTYFLPRIVGRLKAFEMLALGDKISSAQALALGLVNEVVPANELDARVGQLALQFASGPARAVGMIKSMLNQSYQSTLQEVLEIEAENQDTAAKTADFKEGVTAFVEKRRPNYTGC